MPPIRFSAFKHYTYTVAIILLFSKIMLSCAHYKEKKLVYVAITAPFSY